MNQYKRNEANSRSSEIGVQLKPGYRLGRYELVSAVGSGGMGRVWAARDTFAPGMRLVAVKTALREAASDPEAERLFTDEARVASLVQHPNVCPVYELGKDHGALYLVMAWCDGGSLREILSNAENQRLSPELSAGIVARVAAGLHAAHELTDADGSLLGVVHRDVSPQNILVTSTGHVMVADFGIARARGQLHRPTETGEIKGKLSYLAPEQITTREFDRRADVFAAGCVLYEASVGSRAFHGTDALATMYQILERGVEPPSKILPDYPPELERIVLKALTKSVTDRYQTAEALQLDLEEWLAQNRKVVSERLIGDALKAALGPTVTGRNKAIQEAIEAFAKKPSSRRRGDDPRGHDALLLRTGAQRQYPDRHARHTDHERRAPESPSDEGDSGGSRRRSPGSRRPSSRSAASPLSPRSPSPRRPSQPPRPRLLRPRASRGDERERGAERERGGHPLAAHLDIREAEPVSEPSTEASARKRTGTPKTRTQPTSEPIVKAARRKSCRRR